MSEAAQNYVRRIRGYLGDQDPVEILSATSDKLQKIVANASEKDLQNKLSSDQWSRAQVLAHFAEGEIAFSFRLRLIASQPGTPIQGFDQDKWMDHAGYLVEHPQIALQLFRTIRTANLAFLKSLPEETWQHHGIHTERGRETLHDLVLLTAGHDLNHMRQLE